MVAFLIVFDSKVFIGVTHLAKVPRYDAAAKCYSIIFIDVSGELNCCIKCLFLEGIFDHSLDYSGFFILPFFNEGSD